MPLISSSDQTRSALMAASAFAVLYSAYQYYKKEDDHTGIPTPDSAYPYLGILYTYIHNVLF